MSAKENPGLATGASKNSAGELNTANYTAKRMIVLSDAAEIYLDRLAIDLEIGRTEAWQLSPALAQLYWFAFLSGSSSRQSEVDRLTFECDRLYGLAFNPLPLPSGNGMTFEDLEQRRDAIYGGASV